MARQNRLMPQDNKACPFDRIVAGDDPAFVVWASPDALAFLDRRPLFAGHTLVIPREHVESVLELSSESLAGLVGLGQEVARAQRVVLGAEGTFFALNDQVSQSVPHVHLHVVPRRRRDGLRGFFWPRTRYESDRQAHELAEALREELTKRGQL